MHRDHLLDPLAVHRGLGREHGAFLMEGAEHYRAAEELAATARRHITEDPGDMRISEVTAYLAQVHATLALAAAQISPLVHQMMGDSNRITEWARVINWDSAPSRTPQCSVWTVGDHVAERCQLLPDHDGDHHFEGCPF
jgi:hypothetical protein